MDESLSSVIEKYRIRKGLSQRELAQITKVSNSTIARIESGESLVPSNDNLRALGKALDLDYYYLLSLCNQIDDNPDIREIQRATRHMSEEDRSKMMRMLKAVFEEAFSIAGGDTPKA